MGSDGRLNTPKVKCASIATQDELVSFEVHLPSFISSAGGHLETVPLQTAFARLVACEASVNRDSLEAKANHEPRSTQPRQDAEEAEASQMRRDRSGTSIFIFIDKACTATDYIISSIAFPSLCRSNLASDNGAQGVHTQSTDKNTHFPPPTNTALLTSARSQQQHHS